MLPEYFHDNFRHELWHLLNGHYNEFSSDQKKIVIEIIEGLEVVDEDKSVNARATAYKLAIWLSAIKDYSDRTIELYKKYTTITKAEPKHPDFSGYMTSGWVEHKSPIPIEHLFTLSVDSLVETINNYKDTGRGWLDDEHYKNLIVEYLKKFGESPRKNIEKFLRDKLPDILTESQKKNKVTNLLSALRIKGTIRNNGYSKWSPV